MINVNISVISIERELDDIIVIRRCSICHEWDNPHFV